MMALLLGNADPRSRPARGEGLNARAGCARRRGAAKADAISTEVETGLPNPEDS